MSKIKLEAGKWYWFSHPDKPDVFTPIIGVDETSFSLCNDIWDVDTLIGLEVYPAIMPDDASSNYGDGWYDGFLEAKKIADEIESDLIDFNEDDVLRMSEHAESKCQAGKSLGVKP